MAALVEWYGFQRNGKSHATPADTPPPPEMHSSANITLLGLSSRHGKGQKYRLARILHQQSQPLRD